MKVEVIAFVSFEPIENGFRALLPLDTILSSIEDQQPILLAAAEAYTTSVGRMRSLVVTFTDCRQRRVPIPARKVWLLGEIVFDLINELKLLNLEIDGLYDHLVRDLSVKRKWLEKVIILRRYVPNVEIIPESLPWGRCEKGTKAVAKELAKAYQQDAHSLQVLNDHRP